MSGDYRWLRSMLRRIRRKSNDRFNFNLTDFGFFGGPAWLTLEVSGLVGRRAAGDWLDFLGLLAPACLRSVSLQAHAEVEESFEVVTGGH